MTKSSIKRSASTKKVAKKGVVNSSSPLKRNVNIITTAPKQRMVKDGINVIHREFIGPLIASASPADFSIDKIIRLNPGLTVFPWLCSVARNYESYRFKKLHLIAQNYMSAMRDGMVNFCVDYDATDAPPNNLSEMLSNKTAGSYTVGQPFTVKLDVAALNKVGKGKFVRMSDSETADPLLHESGVLYMHASVANELATNTVCQLYLDYEVEFKTPQVKTGSSAREFTNPNSYKKTMNPLSTEAPMNIKGTDFVSIAQTLTDLATNATASYPAASVDTIVNSVLGGNGNTAPPVGEAAQTIINTIMRVQNMSMEKAKGTVGVPGSYYTSWRFVFKEKGRFLLNEIIDMFEHPTQGRSFQDTLVITTTANSAYADINYSGHPVSFSTGYMRLSHAVALDVDIGDYIQFEQQIYETDSTYSATQPLNRICFSLEELSEADFFWWQRTRNVFPAASGAGGVKCLHYHDGAYYGAHVESVVSDSGRSVMKFDPSVVSSLGKHKPYEEDDCRMAPFTGRLNGNYFPLSN